MSFTPNARKIGPRSPARTPILRLGPRVIMSDGFTDGGVQWDMTGDGSIDVIGDVLKVTTGTADTVLETAEFILVPGVTYEVELDIISNACTVQADIDGQTPIAATSATGVVRGEFEAVSELGTLVVTASGDTGSVVEINRVRIKLF